MSGFGVGWVRVLRPYDRTYSASYPPGTKRASHLDLTGKRILVTGASSGIGKAVATMAADRGAAVILHGRDTAKPQAVPPG